MAEGLLGKEGNRGIGEYEYGWIKIKKSFYICPITKSD